MEEREEENARTIFAYKMMDVANRVESEKPKEGQKQFTGAIAESNQKRRLK